MQEALAERAGLSARTIQHLERGATRPYRDTVGRLAQALALGTEAHRRFAGRHRPRHGEHGQMTMLERVAPGMPASS
jgi:transcriptional regulator with XRE-family HTH domain